MYSINQKPEDFVVKEILSLKTGTGKYSYFLMRKIGWDTVRACNEIAKRLNINPKQVSSAGMKDKYSDSEQHISIYDVEPRLVTTLQIPGISLKYLANGPNQIAIGSSTGNTFRVAVRDLKFPLENVSVIPNYYDDQRFGTIRPNTSLVGKKILEGEMEDALHIYLGRAFRREGKRDRTFRKEIDAKWGRWHEVKIPRGLEMEYQIIKYLDDRPKDFAGAFKIIPRQIGSLFLQAYQSYLFNKCLSIYIEKNFDHFFSKYVLDRIAFPKEQKFISMKVPVIGYDMQSSKEFDEINHQIMKDENITPEDFKIKEIPSFSSRSILRDAFVKVNNFTMGSLQDDELNPGCKKQTMTFDLQKGSYATMVVRYAYELARLNKR